MTIITTNFNFHFTQTFTVPVGVFSLATHIIGSSGGGSNVLNHPPGWGPLFDGTLAVTPGEILTLQVGQNGGAAASSSNVGSGTAGYPDGGLGGIGPAFNRGGGGGGSSRIWRGGIGGTLLVLVAGGGGIPARSTSPNPGTGNGGVPVGQTTVGGPPATGSGQDGAPLIPHRGGHGATSIAGGAGGTFGTLNGSAGSSLLGGQGAIGTGGGVGSGAVRSGGGGGGGLFGGGGGASGVGPTDADGGGTGGGGSSYIDMSQGWTATIWDTTVPLEVGVLLGRDGRISFTYNIPDGGGWSLGLVSRLS